MRTAEDFDSYYKSPDPWGISNASRRDRALSQVIAPYVSGKSVLELGCGEGHLTASVFRNAASVHGIDISPTAISRATVLSLPNASFQTSDFLNVGFAGYDVIAAIECIYYLAPDEREAFFRKLTSLARQPARYSSSRGRSSDQTSTEHTSQTVVCDRPLPGTG